MVIKHFLSVPALIICLLTSFSVYSQPKYEGLKVVLIRHGEKPDEGYTLSCQGANRAKALPAVLYSKFGLPGIIYVPLLKDDTTKHSRMYQTIVPFSDKYHLPLNSDYKVDATTGVAKSILKEKGTVLVVWEHKGLEDIAAELGVKEKLKWKKNDFDSIWIITFSKKGKARLAMDVEGLHPSAKCN
jgi:hypothetical protein